MQYHTEYCDICGSVMKRHAWPDEAWGAVKTIVEYECTNTHCEEEEQEEEEDVL